MSKPKQKQEPKPKLKLVGTDKQMNLNTLVKEWTKSYNQNKTHALRDAERNLKGFTPNLQEAMKSFSVDYAFIVAVRNTLQQNGVRR